MPNLKTLARAINLDHREIEEASKGNLHKACVIGRRLLAAKKLVKHGKWRSWQKNNLKFSIRIMRRYTTEIRLVQFSHLVVHLGAKPQSAA
jgi:Protein of unknown function (DUF3102)